VINVRFKNLETDYEKVMNYFSFYVILNGENDLNIKKYKFREFSLEASLIT
jgi:hypothetical protein